MTFLFCPARMLFVLTALVLFSLSDAMGHYCGPPVIRCQPGDVVTYYILSDMVEFGDSEYSVLGQSNPEVAPLVYYSPVARVAGVFVFLAQQTGTNDPTLKWR